MEEGLHLLAELEGILFHPVQGFAGVVDEHLNHVQLGVLLSVDGGVFSPVSQQIFRRNNLAAVGFHAGRRVDGHRAGSVGGVAAHLGRLFNAEHSRAVLRSGQVSRHAGAAEADHDHVIVIQFNNSVRFCHGLVPVGSISAGHLDCLLNRLLYSAGSNGCAGDSIGFQALVFNQPGIQFLFNRGKDHGSIARCHGLYPGQLSAFEGDIQRHLLSHGIGGHSHGVGAVLHRSCFRSGSFCFDHLQCGFDRV